MNAAVPPFDTLFDAHPPASSAVRCSAVQLHAQVSEYRSESPNLCMWMPIAGAAEIDMPRQRRRYAFSNPSVAVLPPGECWEGSWRGSVTSFMLEISPALLAELAPGNINYPDAGRLLVTQDSAFRAGLQALHRNLTEVSPDPLFAEQAGRELVAFYLQQFCGRADHGEHDALSERELRRVREFIHASVGDKITLPQLARLADMSVANFSRRFRMSTGMAPYRYVLQTRIDYAKRALGQQRPLADIALKLGFYDQSQFSNTFRRIVGMSPRQYRQTHS